ncbi:MAG: DUF6249 domain-containing protein [bacterium]|nr:DUF6249 domain-containing protein [bacterium]
MDTDTLAMLIGLVAVLGTFVVVIVIVLAALRSRRIRNEMLHRERMLALEKGVPVPMDYADSPRHRRPYVVGLIWAGIGLGIIIWGSIEGESDINAWGFIPLFVGVALLIGDYVASRRERKNDSDSAAFPADHQ